MTRTLVDFNRRNPCVFKEQVSGVLPEHFAEMYPDLVKFLEKYYEFAQTDPDHGFDPVIETLKLARDIEDSTLTQLNLLFKEIGLNVLNTNYFFDPRNFARVLAFFLRTKGSRLSAEMFFRAFYRTTAEIQYPKRNIIIVGESPIGAEDLFVIQDGALYQIYSILVKTEIPSIVWRDLYKILVHPAGFYLGSQVAINSLADLALGEMPVAINEGVTSIISIISQSPIDITAAYTDATILIESGLTNYRFNVDETIELYQSLSIDQLSQFYSNIVEIGQSSSPTMDVDSAVGIDFSNAIETMDRVEYGWYDSV